MTLSRSLLILSAIIIIIIIANSGNTSFVCKTPNNEIGICIAIAGCPNVWQPLTSLSSSALQFMQQSFCGEWDPTNVSVCCGLRHIKSIDDNNNFKNDEIGKVNVEFANTNIAVKVNSIENETKLTLTFKKTDQGSKKFNLEIESNGGTLKKPTDIVITEHANITEENPYEIFESNDNTTRATVTITTDEVIESFGNHTNTASDGYSENITVALPEHDYQIFEEGDDEADLPLFNNTTQRIFVISQLLVSSTECGHLANDVRKLEDYPWIAYLFSERENETNAMDYACTGVIINKRYVLSSVLCAKGTKKIYVGVYHIDQIDNCKGSSKDNSTLNVDEITYMSSDGYDIFDLALLRLVSNITFSDCVKPICLPLNKNNLLPATYKSLSVSGWTTPHGSAKKYLTYFFTNALNCFNYDNSTFVCMKPGTKSSGTFHEEGGPLMYNKINQWYLYGTIVTVYMRPYETRKIVANVGLDGIKVTAETIEWILDTIRP